MHFLCFSVIKHIWYFQKKNPKTLGLKNWEVLYPPTCRTCNLIMLVSSKFVRTNSKVIPSPPGVALPKQKLNWSRRWETFVSYIMLYNILCCLYPLLQHLVLHISHCAAYSHTAHSHRSRLAPPILPARRSSMLIIHPEHTDPTNRQERIPLSDSTYLECHRCWRPEAFLCFSQLSHTHTSFCSSLYSILSTKQKHILYPWACPRCPQLWGNVRCFTAHQICTLSQIHTECRAIWYGHTHTHFSEQNLINWCMHWFSPRSGLGGTSLVQSGECQSAHNSTG